MSPDPPRNDGPPTEREVILEIMAKRIREIDERLDRLDPEPDDREGQQQQIKWTRTLGYLAGQYRKLMKDTDIDEMEDTLGMLKEASELDYK